MAPLRSIRPLSFLLLVPASLFPLVSLAVVGSTSLIYPFSHVSFSVARKAFLVFSTKGFPFDEEVQPTKALVLLFRSSFLLHS